MALRLWVERGYEAVGVQEICTAAGVTKPTLYHYFGSKSRLLRTLIELNWQRMAEYIPPDSFDPSDVAGTVERICAGWLAYVRAHPRLARLFTSLYYGPRDSEATAIGEEQQKVWIARLERFYEQAAEYHGNMRNRSRAYAASFAGLLLTYGALLLNREGTPDPGLPYAIARQFMYGIFS